MMPHSGFTSGSASGLSALGTTDTSRFNTWCGRCRSDGESQYSTSWECRSRLPGASRSIPHHDLRSKIEPLAGKNPFEQTPSRAKPDLAERLTISAVDQRLLPTSGR